MTFAAGHGGGQAFSFDGVDDYVGVPAAAMPAGDFSVEAWVNFQSLNGPTGPQDMAIFADQEPVNGAGWRLLKQQNQNQIWAITTQTPRAQSGSVAAGQWYHVVGTFANWGQAGSTVALYLDGVLQGSSQIFSDDPTPDLRIGGYIDINGNGPMYGLIDEVKIYDVALTAAQVTAAFNGQTGTAGRRDVVLFDADGDGDLDVAAANENTDNVSLWSNAAGSLASPTVVALTAADLRPVALARGDLDNDGQRDDLAVACAGSGRVVLLTNPAAVAPGRVSVATPGAPGCVAVGDLDTDPIDDLVVGRTDVPFTQGAGLSLIRNGGAPADLVIPSPHPTNIVKVVLGDLNGDGHVDLAALAHGVFSTTVATDELLLFAGDGAGALTFAGAFGLPTGGVADGLCADDLDGNGTLDLAVGLPTLSPASQSLRVLRRTGTGALATGLFTAGSDIASSGWLAVDLASGDLEDDSIPGFLSLMDVAHANAGTGNLIVRHGYNGAASSFVASSTGSSGAASVAVAIGDLNGDGCDDFVVADQASDDLTVSLTVPTALAQSYGTGCTGAAGVPVNTAVGMPTSGNPVFGVQVSSARAFAPAFIVFASGVGNLPLGGGCSLLVDSQTMSTMMLFTNLTGTATLRFGVPSALSFRGLDLFFQWAVFDSQGAFGPGTMALSNALRIQVGI